MRHEDFLNRLTLEYPITARSTDIGKLIAPTLIANEAVTFPRRWLEQAERLTKLFYHGIRESSFSEENIAKIPPAFAKPTCASVLMSYDYHVDFSDDPKGRLKLIEINTNASMSLLLDVLNCQIGVGRCLKDEFLEDFESALGRPLKDQRVAIVDENPTAQKLFIEFLMYKELFESRGASCQILDRSQLQFENGLLTKPKSQTVPVDGGSDAEFGPIDLVYNRLTDFYFEQPESTALKNALLTGKTVITPHPYDYRALADKTRMIEWSRAGGLERYGLSNTEKLEIQKCLIPTRDIAEFDPDVLWKERKHLIFKPKTSHAGKGVYRGSSISRGAFQGVLDSGGIAQDFIPAPQMTLGGQELKYDLRFFAFRDRINVACARLYQGQTTNSTTPGGGVASIKWSDST